MPAGMACDEECDLGKRSSSLLKDFFFCCVWQAKFHAAGLGTGWLLQTGTWNVPKPKHEINNKAGLERY